MKPDSNRIRCYYHSLDQMIRMYENGRIDEMEYVHRADSIARATSYLFVARVWLMRYRINPDNYIYQIPG